MYFHDDNAWIEDKGFWARGGAALALTVGVRTDRQPTGVPLQVHSGGAPTAVRMATPAWSTTVDATPDTFAAVFVPARAGQLLLPLTITPAKGYVPAEHEAASADRRHLGCWVEVTP